MFEPLKEVNYFPESELRHPRQLLRSMFASLGASRELAWNLAVRNINAKYRDSLFGYLWAFLPPVLTTITWVFLNSQKIMSSDNTGIPYPVYVMIGTLMWEVFVDGLNQPTSMIARSKGMIARIKFPYEALILASLGEVIFNFVIRATLLVAIMLWYSVPVGWTILLAPLGILSLLALGMMFGLLLIPIGMLFGDIRNGLPFITSFWFLLTPVVYSSPKSWPASLLVDLNPVSILLITTRDWITTGVTLHLTEFLVVCAGTLVLLFLGWLNYRLSMPHIIARIGS